MRRAEVASDWPLSHAGTENSSQSPTAPRRTFPITRQGCELIVGTAVTQHLDECLALSWQEFLYLEMDTCDAGTLAPVHNETLGR